MTAEKHTMPTGATVWYYPEGHDYCTKGPDEHKPGKCFKSCKFRVPGASTIAKNDGDTDAGGLIDWAVRLAEQGLDWREERNKKAERGTDSHSVLQALAEGTTPILRNGYDHAVADWWTKHEPGVELCEEVVFDSRRHFAGRFDLLAYHPDHTGRTLIDLKTSSGLSNSFAVQLNLYALGMEAAGYPIPLNLMVLWVFPNGWWKEVPVPLQPRWALDALSSYKTGKEIRSLFSKAWREAQQVKEKVAA